MMHSPDSIPEVAFLAALTGPELNQGTRSQKMPKKLRRWEEQKWPVSLFQSPQTHHRRPGHSLLRNRRQTAHLDLGCGQASWVSLAWSPFPTTAVAAKVPEWMWRSPGPRVCWS